MTLVRGTGGKILRKANGALARDLSCCCYAPPPECPNCCVEITWGSFDVNGDLIEVHPELQVTLVMPTKNSRVVCDGEEVTVRITYFDFDEETLPSDGSPYITWDHAWKYQSHTPAVGAGGAVYETGLVEWGELVGDPLEDTYEVVLAYTHCWADHGEQIGDIEAGDRGGSFSLITGVFCEGSADCCTYPITCEPCCFYLGGDAWEIIDGEVVFWDVAANGDRMKVVITGIDAEKRTICIPGAGITLSITLTPREHTGDPWFPSVSVDGEGWTHISHTPDVGNGSFDDGPPAEIDWGTDVDELEYSTELSVECPNIPGLITISSTTASDGTVGGHYIEIPWVCCDGAGECDDCYPAPDRNFIHCFVDLSSSTAEAVLDVNLADFPDGTFAPENLINWKVLAVWENYCCVENDPEGSGIRFLHYIFKCCGYTPGACDAADAAQAFDNFAQATYGRAATCGQQVPGDTVSVATVIENTLGEAASAGDPGYQIIYIQDDDLTCPPCPEDWV